MKSFATFCFLIFCVLASQADAQWPRGQGKGYAQFSLGQAQADQSFDANRNKGPLGTTTDPEDYTEWAFYRYFEYGLTDLVTLTASSVGKRIQVKNRIGEHRTTGFSDLVVQLRYTVLQKGPLVVSPHVGLKVPTGYSSSSAPPLGSGSLDAQANVSFGLSLHPTPGYLSGSLGFQFRGNTVQNEYYGHFEGGFFPTPKVLLRGRLDLVESTSNSVNSFTMMVQNTEQGYLHAGPGLSILFSPKWQWHTDARWTLTGRTTSKLFTVISGLAYVW